jgi:hypothetical protein
MNQAIATLAHLKLSKDQQTRETSAEPGPTAFIRLTFPYDPYLIARVKGMPARWWIPTEKAWVVPYSLDSWRDLTNQLGPALVAEGKLAEMVREEEIRRDHTTMIKAAGDGDVAGYENFTPPFAHQRMGHKLLDVNDRYALLWEMGTGKTKSIIDDILWRKLSGRLRGPALVFCPSTVRFAGWERQVKLHSGGKLTVEVLDGSTKKRRQRLHDSTADVLILNHESCLFLGGPSSEPGPEKKYCLLNPRETIGQETWPYVVFDEVTAYKNISAKRTRIALKMPMAVIRILTGTPVTNSPADAYAPFSILDPTVFGNWIHFKDHYLVMGGYGGYEIIGYRNVQELTDRIMSRSSRVLAKDVLDLPPVTHHQYDVLLEGETLRHYEAMRKELKTKFSAGEIKAQQTIVQIMRLSQIAGGLLQVGNDYDWIPDNPKQKAVEEIISELPPTAKLVIFCVFRKEIEELRSYFAALDPVVIYGDGTSAEQRGRDIARFQDQSSSCRLVLAQIHSGGFGIDLFAAQTAVFYTLNYSLEDYLQAMKRLDRYGQTGTVNVISLVAKLPPKANGEPIVSVDTSKLRILGRKQKTADLVTGDKELSKQDLQEIVAEVVG